MLLGRGSRRWRLLREERERHELTPLRERLRTGCEFIREADRQTTAAIALDEQLARRRDRVSRVREASAGQADRQCNPKPQAVSITVLTKIWIKIAFGTNMDGAASLIV